MILRVLFLYFYELFWQKTSNSSKKDSQIFCSNPYHENGHYYVLEGLRIFMSINPSVANSFFFIQKHEKTITV